MDSPELTATAARRVEPSAQGVRKHMISAAPSPPARSDRRSENPGQPALRSSARRSIGCEFTGVGVRPDLPCRSWPKRRGTRGHLLPPRLLPLGRWFLASREAQSEAAGRLHLGDGIEPPCLLNATRRLGASFCRVNRVRPAGGRSTCRNRRSPGPPAMATPRSRGLLADAPLSLEAGFCVALRSDSA